MFLKCACIGDAVSISRKRGTKATTAFTTLESMSSALRMAGGQKAGLAAGDLGNLKDAPRESTRESLKSTRLPNDKSRGIK